MIWRLLTSEIDTKFILVGSRVTGLLLIKGMVVQRGGKKCRLDDTIWYSKKWEIIASHAILGFGRGRIEFGGIYLIIYNVISEKCIKNYDLNNLRV